MLLQSLVTGLAIASATALPFQKDVDSNGTSTAIPAESTFPVGTMNVTSTDGAANGTMMPSSMAPNATAMPSPIAPNATVITTITSAAIQPNGTTVLPGGTTSLSNHTVYQNYTITEAPKPTTYTAVIGGVTKTTTIGTVVETTCIDGVTIETCPVCDAQNSTVTATPANNQTLTYTAVVGGTTETKTVGNQTVTTCVGGTTVETCFNCGPVTSASSTQAPEATSTATVPSCAPPAYFKPKVMIVNMFELEQTQWIEKLELTENITVPMLSPVYPHVHANKNWTIMSFTTGEAESNAAASFTALLSSSLFDFSETYFLISGIAGGSPIETSIGSVTFPKFAVQVGSAYELDSREIPGNWTYGYVNYGDDQPNKYPTQWYGTEVFELNGNLRNRALALANNATLTNLTSDLEKLIHKYNSSYAAVKGPQVVACDTATSDVYWKGFRLAQWAEDTVRTYTNGTAKYCSTQQEDNASLEAILRATKFGLVDYNRVVISRSISDFDRPFNGVNVTQFALNGTLSYAGQSTQIALDNLYNAGLPFVQDVITNWESLYKVNHFNPKNYTGDYFETLGGKKNF
ncbi:hypothetical protein ZYGR_0U00250 [Zygosaccharomyces rouxii]|uniref:ZYRO0F09262p n=2 Tax=Zygosaccharomyces rouxii TaxID=4956 RepID=C5DY06_ZYGRC|nr:uncharacterized protein ZYRO0F09262g [Zygosaccharomyces rouxii]KAH9199426.1 purine nucleoside permease-domain-containing protein [Zygosaccharomyces rouxii]GAV50169.1 hypothetical protein ZYGR_0U00250 [Zygosaccharomyces rouxii]CAR28667.1 ZYRO0F09262p [Zygosaccharomyces rouxii]